jgi:hypothetical protein
VLAIRIVPRLAELAERVLDRTRGLIASLLGRQIARRPLRYTRAALLLILAAALGTFASAHAATWTRSQADQAAWTAGSDVRMTPGQRSDIPPFALGAALRAVPGVTAATPVVRASIDLGSTIRGGTLVAIDGSAMADVVRLRDDVAGETTVAGLRALGDRRPETPGLELPEGTRRLSVTYDSAFTPVEGYEPVPEGYEGLTAAALLVDGDGRVVRVDSEPGPVGVEGARLEIPLTGPAGAQPTGPLHLIGLDLTLSIADIPNGVAQGQIDLTGAATSTEGAGNAWTPLDLASIGGRWIQDLGGNRQPFEPRPGPTITLPVDQLFQFFNYGWEMTALPDEPPPLPALVDQAFLDRTGARIGDALNASVLGVPVTLDLLAQVDGFPPIDQTKPYVIVDALAMDLARAGAGGSIVDTDEWWLSVAPGEREGVVAALRSAPLSAGEVVDRTAVTADLAGDPLGLGVIGILGLGSLAALVFASIGFLVSATVSISERIGEFALLKALGLAPRQLLLWLSIENLMLLATGLILGTLLGLLLAYLVLPFATLTPTGEPPVPAPVIVVPPEAALPTVALAALLVLATVVLAARQLPSARTSSVLRARDE